LKLPNKKQADLLNTKDLKYFLAVVELEHFGQAAERCEVSQPTLSAQIKKLEEVLGVTLFERSNRSVMVTEIGNQIAVHARKILREVDTIKDIADCSRDPLAGKFRLGAFPTLSTYIFPKIVPQVKATMPSLRLILLEEKTDALINKLKLGELDAALLALPIHEDSMVSHTLFEDPFMLAVPEGHELANHERVDQKALTQYRLLLLEEGHCLRDQSLEVCKLHGIAEDQDFKATGLETLRQMVKAGTGMTFMPNIAIHESDPGIQYVPFKPPAPSRTIGLVWRKTTARQQVINRIIGFF
jgi:LysR family hydrogen peroxide-inducible transcriptional activator